MESATAQVALFSYSFSRACRIASVPMEGNGHVHAEIIDENHTV
jgi:hypothetical protein